MEKLLEVKNLKKFFPVKKGFWNKIVGNVYAVNDVSFDIYKGETFAIVGESGCGKSTTGKCIAKLEDVTDGSIVFNGVDITTAPKNKIKDLRKDIQVIFQNPFSSLNPRMSVDEILKEPFVVNKVLHKKELDKKIKELLEMVGMPETARYRLPHEFSGGQRQRIVIARALALHPQLIIADEPVSALDVSIQAQIINLMQDLKKELNLTYLFISHDLSVVKYLSDRVAVMYLGEIVELASCKELFEKPLHPYTQALLEAVPVVEFENKKNVKLLEGDIPSPSNPPSGCKFHTRCPNVMDICKIKDPCFEQESPNHFVSCHLYD